MNNYYQKQKEDGDVDVIRGTPFLKSLHQEFIATLCVQSKKDRTVLPSVIVNPYSDLCPPLVQEDSNTSYTNDLRYHCYKLVSPSLSSLFNSVHLEGCTVVGGKESDGQFEFKGFMIISRKSLDELPPALSREFDRVLSLSLEPHPLPQERFVVQDLILFAYYLFDVLLETHNCFTDDLQIYFYPVFTNTETNETATMATVLRHLLDSYKLVLLKPPTTLSEESALSKHYTNHLFYNPQQRPSTLRVDRLTWHKEDGWQFIHFSNVIKEGGASLPVCSSVKDRRNQQSANGDEEKGRRREGLKTKSSNEEILVLSCDGHMTTGVKSDVACHALLLPVIFKHVRYQNLLTTFEEKLGYCYKNRTLLQTALTHPSYLSIIPGNYSPLLVSQDHCGAGVTCVPGRSWRRRQQCHSTGGSSNKRPKGRGRPKRSGLDGLSAAVNFSTDQGNIINEDSSITAENMNNERLEFLGDAVIEVLTSHHLYHLFPEYSDGQLVIYRKALVCNENLARIADESLCVEKYMLIGVSTDLSTDCGEAFHARANALEAIIGSICLDSGGRLEAAGRVLGTLFFPEKDLHDTWIQIKPHPLQQQYPQGDRHLIPGSSLLQTFAELEEKVGVVFTNICLLGRAFIHPSFGYTDLFKGHYQRMEFLGDAILQYVSTMYVYNTFPNSHEGHLTALRMAIVHNKQLARVSDELGFNRYIVMGRDQIATGNMSEKVRADVVESFLAALYLDKGIEYAEKFCDTCLFPKLYEEAKGLQFLDPKSRLQHSLVYTCKRKGLDYEPPSYRVLEVSGPGHNRKCTVGVYFKRQRLAVGIGTSTHNAGMDAAEKALLNDSVLLPRALQK